MTLAASFQPYQPIQSAGKLNLTLGSDFDPNSRQNAPDCASGNTACIAQLKITNPSNATLAINLPPVARAGGHYKWRRRAGCAEYVWQGWSVNKEFVLTTDAQISSGNKQLAALGISVPPSIAPIHIHNGWYDSSSVRGGVGYDFPSTKDSPFLLQGNLGAMWETNPTPSAFQTLPFITGKDDRVGISAGATFALHNIIPGDLGVSASFMYYLPDSFKVSNSALYKTGAIPDVVPQNIGNGTYSVDNFWQLGIGLYYHLG